MAKKKKTRKQKILAESRRNSPLITKETTSPSHSEVTPNDLPRTSEYVFKMKEAGKISSSRVKPLSGHDYTHLRHDLTKTGILTSSIVIAQLVLFYILK